VSSAENGSPLADDHRSSRAGERTTKQLEYELQGPAEAIGDALGFVSRRVQGDLERFRDFIEARGVETGGWRGEVRQEPTRSLLTARHDAPITRPGALFRHGRRQGIRPGS
jgi:hypothetical protein